MLSPFVHGAWVASGLSAHRRFARALARPEDAQTTALARVVRTASAGSARLGGPADGLRGVTRLSDLRRLPITSYEDYAPAIDEIRLGRRAGLTAEPVLRLVPTGGSLGPRKWIPYTAALRRDLGEALSAWMVDLYRTLPGLAFGSAYWSVSPAFDVAMPSSVPVGFESDAEYLAPWLAPLVSRVLVAPASLRRARPPAAFLYTTLRLLLGQPSLRLLSFWHPSFWTLLEEPWSRRFEALVRDVHDGTIRPDPPLADAALASSLARGLRPNPARAHALERLGPAAPLAAAWPRLLLVSAWGDARAEAPFEALRAKLGGVRAQRKGLLATEAFVTIPYRGFRPMCITSHVFELVNSEGRALAVHEARIGEEYDALVTTSSGFVRYALGDRVRVDGFVERTPSLTFVGRTGSVVNLVGEKLHEAFVENALRAALPNAPSFAMLAPDSGPAYTLFVSEEPHDAAAVLVRLEQQLRESPTYAYARDLGQLGPLRLFYIASGAHRAFVDDAVRRGRALGDVKPTALGRHDGYGRLFEGSYRDAVSVPFHSV